MLCKIRCINFNKDENAHLKLSVTNLNNQNEQLKAQLKMLMNKILSPKTSSNMQKKHNLETKCPTNTPQSQDSGMCVSESSIGKVSIDDSDEFTRNADSGICVDSNQQNYELSATKSTTNTKEADNTVTSTTVENNSKIDLVLANNEASHLMMVQCGKPKVHKADEISKVSCENNNFFTFKYQDPSKQSEINNDKVNNNNSSDESHPKIYWVDQSGKCESTQLANNNKNPVASYNEFVEIDKPSSSFRKETVKVMQESLQLQKLDKKRNKNSQSLNKSIPRLSKVTKNSQEAPKLSEVLQSELKRRFSLSPADMVAKKSKKSRRLIKVVPKKKKKIRVTLATKIAEISSKKIPSLDNNDGISTLICNGAADKKLSTVVVKQEPSPNTSVELAVKSSLVPAPNKMNLETEFAQKVNDAKSIKKILTKATVEQAYTSVKENVTCAVDAGLLKPVKQKAVLILKDLKCDTATLKMYNLSHTSLKRILKQQSS